MNSEPGDAWTRRHNSVRFSDVENTILDELELAENSDDLAEEAAARSLAAAIAKTHGVRASLSAKKLLTILSNPNVSLNEVSKTIEIDSSLAARVLRVVNSAAYGLRVRVRKINVAVTLLGTKKLNEIATAAAVLDWFEQDTVTVPEIFRLSAATAALSRHIATRCALPPEDCYTCGLLHDYGKLILMQTGDESYAELINRAGRDDDLYLDERARYGYDHAILGARVLAEWNLPEPLPSVIALHHQPARAFKLGGVLGRMVAALRWAERLTYEFDRAVPIDDVWLAEMAKDECVVLLGLARGDFRQFCLDLHLTWMESQQVQRVDGDDDGPNENPFVSALRGVNEAVVQKVAQSGWNLRSVAVFIGAASVVLACAEVFARWGRGAGTGWLASLLWSMSHAMLVLAVLFAVTMLLRLVGAISAARR